MAKNLDLTDPEVFRLDKNRSSELEFDENVCKIELENFSVKIKSIG